VSTPARSVLAPVPKPAPTPADAGRDPGENARAGERPAAKARRLHCFFQEDDRTKIATRSGKATLVEDAQGQCHRCRPEKRKAFLETLTADEDCAHKYTCAREPQSSCDAPSPG
jgi:hypothetical protein